MLSALMAMRSGVASWLPPLMHSCTRGAWQGARMPQHLGLTDVDCMQGPATRSLGTESSSPGAGLFGLPELKQPSDFNRMLHDARGRCEDLMTSLLKAQPDARIVQLMDEMSDTLCRCYDAAEACRNIHDDPSWRAAASNVCHELGAYISRVNHHEGLYAQLSAALAAAGHPRPGSRHLPHTHPSHPPPPSTQPSTSSSGSSSSSQHSQQVEAQSEGWCHETLRVGQQLALDMEKAGIHLPEPGRGRMQVLMNDSNHYAAAFNKALREPRQLGSCRVRGSAMTLTPANVASVMANEQDEYTRQEVWRAASRSPASNVSLLEAMCSARHEQAQLLDQHSYSSYKAQGASLAENPAAIVGFLERLATDVRPLADREVKSLGHTKASLLGSLDPHHVSVAPWDTEFLMAATRRNHRVASKTALLDYTHLTRVLEGLGELLRRSMGVTLAVKPAGHKESWAHGVLRCDASHPDLGHMGTVYLDLCSRPGKYPSAVTFPIRCGRQLPDGTYQTPVMALLADFGPAYCSPGDVRLSARELRVLLHEWGHCMHNLASRTRYQHLAGTRCAQDLVELPSHLFEHWAADPRSLRLLARHHATNDPLPQDACDALRQQRRLFAGLELQQQVLLSLADQRLFGSEPIGAGGTSQAWASATTPFSSLPWAKGSHPEARMSHLTIYGATYYSYVYARCLSAAVWNKYLAADPLAPGAGQAVLQDLLKPGGAVEPVTLITGILGSTGLTQYPGGGWAPSMDDKLLHTAMATFG